MAIVDELIALLGYEIKGADKLKQWQDSLSKAEDSATDAATAISGTTDAVDGLAPAAGRASGAIDRAGDSAKRSSVSIAKIGAAAGAATTAAIALGTKALMQFASFELSMNRIGIAAGASSQQVVAASNDVQRLAQQFALPIDKAVAGLDTLTASGMSLQQAMAFLPSVLATAQASGAATEDIANSIQKVSLSLGISAKDAQSAFDIMVAGGKAGQFELKDMAQYIPELSSAFGTLGYTGEDGLRKLIALMQTLREKTGTSGAAATQLSNILGKIYSEQTAKNFANFGIDLETEMQKARAAGEDTITAFTRLSNLAIGGDLTKLGQLFTDQEFRLGMASLMTGADSMERFSAALRNVDGSTMKDLSVILSGTDAKLQKLSNSYERFMNSAGAALSGPVGGALETVTNDLDYGEAIRSQLEKQGMSYWQRENWMFLHSFDQKAKDELARAGGYTGPVTQNRRTPGVPIFPNQISDLRDKLGTGTAALVDRSSAPNATMADIDAIIARSAIKFKAEDPGRAAIDDLQAKVLAGQQSQFEALRAQIDASMGRATGAASIAPVINDSRQDNRSTTVNITQNIAQASAAPRAAAEATGRAVTGAANSAVATPGRIAAEPATSWGGPR